MAGQMKLLKHRGRQTTGNKRFKLIKSLLIPLPISRGNPDAKYTLKVVWYGQQPVCSA